MDYGSLSTEREAIVYKMGMYTNGMKDRTFQFLNTHKSLSPPLYLLF